VHCHCARIAYDDCWKQIFRLSETGFSVFLLVAFTLPCASYSTSADHCAHLLIIFTYFYCFIMSTHSISAIMLFCIPSTSVLGVSLFMPFERCDRLLRCALQCSVAVIAESEGHRASARGGAALQIPQRQRPRNLRPITETTLQGGQFFSHFYHVSQLQCSSVKNVHVFVSTQFWFVSAVCLALILQFRAFQCTSFEHNTPSS